MISTPARSNHFLSISYRPYSGGHPALFDKSFLSRGPEIPIKCCFIYNFYHFPAAYGCIHCVDFVNLSKTMSRYLCERQIVRLSDCPTRHVTASGSINKPAHLWYKELPRRMAYCCVRFSFLLSFTPLISLLFSFILFYLTFFHYL